jgi:alpha-maltose-1-phosphate synthase
MRILYCAIDQRVPGTLGGSVHTERVATGLASLGHVVTALVMPGDGPLPSGAVEWQAVPPPFGRPHLRALRAPHVARIADAFRPDIVMERYHNFGGEAVRAALRLGVPVALEVNAPIVDHPGSAKQLVDRALLVQPMRRWRDWQCAHTDLFITPSRATLPEWVASDRVLEIEWGADTDRFRPGASGPVPFERPAGTVAVFAGAFRAWHGAIHLVRAVALLRRQGVHDISAVLIGRGPEWTSVREAAAGTTGIEFTGTLPHDAMPSALAACDIGVAPFDVSRHRSLSLEFYWSPLKVFEYMASGLPVVAPRIPRLARLLEDGHEGRLYDADDPNALAATLLALHKDPAARAALGASARLRAVADYSWRAHCERLSSAFSGLVRRRA